MNKIDNKTFQYFGLVPVKFTGLLDMPKRLGEVVMDWGGGYKQPIVDEFNINWSSKTFVIKALFDTRITTRAYEDVLSELSELEEFALETKFGVSTVRLNKVKLLKEYTLVKDIELNFIEQNPAFDGVLENAIGGGQITIDDYSLENDFGVIIKGIKLRDEISGLIKNNSTVFQESKPYSKNRELTQVDIDCVINGSEDYVISSVKKIQKLLSLEGMRVIRYKNKKYNAFHSAGFIVKVDHNTLTHFKMTLSLCDCLFETGLFEEGFIN